ncbi:MAG: hypothetical protein R3B91_14495 [Planctomycetaceae bacterium]
MSSLALSGRPVAGVFVDRMRMDTPMIKGFRSSERSRGTSSGRQPSMACLVIPRDLGRPDLADDSERRWARAFLPRGQHHYGEIMQDELLFPMSPFLRRIMTFNSHEEASDACA